jgi:pyruvate dehydrogenase (quinone)
LPRKGAVVQVDGRVHVLGRRAPTALGVIGSVRPALLGRVKRKSDAGFFDRITTGRKAWDEMLDKQSNPARSKDLIHPQAVARAVSDLAARNAVCVFDTGLITLWSGNWIRQKASSGSLAPSTIAPSAPRSVRPMASKPSTARARSSRSAATAASTC